MFNVDTDMRIKNTKGSLLIFYHNSVLTQQYEESIVAESNVLTVFYIADSDM